MLVCIYNPSNAINQQNMKKIMFIVKDMFTKTLMRHKFNKLTYCIIVGLFCVACTKDSQEAPDPTLKEEGTILIVSGKTVSCSVFGTELNVKIRQNTSYDIQTSTDWIHQIDTRALNDETLTFKVDFNKTQKERQGEISIIKKEDGEKLTVLVIQRGGLWITCPIAEAGKKSWTATDTIGVYSSSLNNVPFIFFDGLQFVADREGSLGDVSAAYYPYNSNPETEIADNDVTNCLVADASFQFAPVAYPLTISGVDKAEEVTCRLVADSAIFGPWKLSEGKIEPTSSSTEQTFVSGSLSVPLLAKTKENIAIIVKRGSNMTAEKLNIEMDGAKSITHQYEKIYQALDAEDNANCYIIDKEGSYCFALRDAAGGLRWTGSDCRAELIWADYAKDFILNPTIVGDIVCFDAQMSSSKQGNAGLALKDAQGKILWSWHLWLTDQTNFRTVEKGKLLNIPLGSITNSRDFQYGDHYHALIYQYGRKDPFPIQGPDSEYLAITNEGLNAYDNCGGFGTFYRRDWREGTFDESQPMVAAESDDGLFGYSNVQPQNIKWNVIDWDEVNNPCPPGFSVPKGDVVWKYMTGLDGQYAAWPGLKVKDLTAVKVYNNGLLNIAENYWFPAVKFRSPLYGVENQYHPYCAIPADSIYLWIKKTTTNAGGYTNANAVSWKTDDIGGIEIDAWAWGYYMSMVCVKD